MDFKQRVYQLVKKIPPGKVSTYKEIAREMRNTKLGRAVGQALRHNPYPFTTFNKEKQIPCHRVINSNGSLGGFNQGVEQKIKLLNQEGIKIINNKIDLDKYLFKF